MGFSTTSAINDYGNNIICVNPSEKEHIPVYRATNIANSFKPPGREKTNGDFMGCAWAITSRFRNDVVQLSFSNVRLQSEKGCTDEFIAVFEGKDNTTRLLELFCGSTSPSFLSTGRSFEIHFYTRYSNYDFAIAYHSVSKNALKESEARNILISSSIIFILIVPVVAFLFMFLADRKDGQHQMPREFEESTRASSDAGVRILSKGNKNRNVPLITISRPDVDQISVAKTNLSHAEGNVEDNNGINYRTIHVHPYAERNGADLSTLKIDRPSSPTTSTGFSCNFDFSFSDQPMSRDVGSTKEEIAPHASSCEQDPTIQDVETMIFQDQGVFETHTAPAMRSSSLTLVHCTNSADTPDFHASKSWTDVSNESAANA